MMKIANMKKVVLIGLLIVLSILPQSSFALPDWGEFNYWYSNDGAIGYLDPTITSPKIYYTKLPIFGLASEDFLSVVNYGFDKWKPTTNKTRQMGSNSDYHIKAEGVGRGDANYLGIPSSVVAWTENTIYAVAKGTYKGSTKIVNKITKSHIRYIWDTGVEFNTSNFSLPKWSSLSAHEFGHALGYSGHDLGASYTNKSLMNPYVDIFYDNWNVSAPTTRDTNYLGQVY